MSGNKSLLISFLLCLSLIIPSIVFVAGENYKYSNITIDHNDYYTTMIHGEKDGKIKLSIQSDNLINVYITDEGSIEDLNDFNDGRIDDFDFLLEKNKIMNTDFTYDCSKTGNYVVYITNNDNFEEAHLNLSISNQSPKKTFHISWTLIFIIMIPIIIFIPIAVWIKIKA